MPSVAFDAVFISGGERSIATLIASDDVMEFLRDAYKHAKAIACGVDGAALLQAAGLDSEGAGIVVGRPKNAAMLASDFIGAIAAHRHWARVAKKSPMA